MLAESVDNYINKAQLPEIDGEIVAVVAPHAGHLYSGPVAGYAFASLRSLEIDLVALISPMHHHYLQPLLTSGHTAYQTPLGQVPVDRDAVLDLDRRLKARLEFGLSSVKEDPEHSLEIELPFLQRALPSEFQILPIMVRDQCLSTAKELGEALTAVLKGRRAILVASTDLSHFYPQDTANRLDKTILKMIGDLDPEGIFEAEAQGRGYACGRGALAAVLWASKGLGANRAIILRYATSGDVTGDYDQVVGYASALITRPAAGPS
jgi:MEMO1 family protein